MDMPSKRWITAAGVWFYFISIPLIYICTIPYTPASVGLGAKDWMFIFAYSLLPALFAAFFWWLAYHKRVRFIASGGSIGLLISLALLPFYLSYFLAGTFLVIVWCMLGMYVLRLAYWVHSKATKSNLSLEADASRRSA